MTGVSKLWHIHNLLEGFLIKTHISQAILLELMSRLNEFNLIVICYCCGFPFLVIFGTQA